jgi:hypothetical protein
MQTENLLIIFHCTAVNSACGKNSLHVSKVKLKLQENL